MTRADTISDLDRLHAEYLRALSPNLWSKSAQFADAWPAISAYIKALEFEVESSRAVLKTHGHHECSLVVMRSGPPTDDEVQDGRDRVRRLVQARRATDAARAKMEDADG